MATSVTLKPNAIDISGSTSGTTTLQASAVAGTTTLTLPAATDTLVGKATTDTLTNKTLTGAVMNGTLGATTPSTASVTTLTTSSTVTHSGGTANGVAYLDGSKVLTTGSALVFDGTNLGLGVTPSGNYQLQTQSNFTAGSKGFSLSSFSGGASGNGIPFVGYNIVPTSTASSYKYTQADVASAISFYDGLKFYVAPSGTAGNTISFTQAMTLDASGKLGVGSTAPSTILHLRTSAANLGVSQIFENSSGTEKNWLIGRNNTTGFEITPSTAAGGLTFTTPALVVDSSGNLLVGTTSGTKHVLLKNNSNNEAVQIENSASSNPYGSIIYFSAAAPNDATRYFLNCQDNAASRATIRSNGGLANYSANDVNLSDRREKTNFAPAGSYLDKICAIPVQTFNYIDQNLEDDAGLTLGVVAQDVQAIAPELVMESNWGTEDDPKVRLSIYQTDLQYALMKCIQEQQAIIQSLTARITALESA